MVSSPEAEGFAEILVLFFIFLCFLALYGLGSLIVDGWRWYKKRHER